MNDLAERTFLPEDQIAFAKLSGDQNPMHMDPVAARRTQAGYPVVHGVHAILWALNAAGGHLRDFGALSVRFERMIYVGDRCVLRQRQRRGEGFSLDILVDETVVTRIDLGPAVEGRHSSEHEKHSFAVEATPALFEEAFPEAAAVLGGAFLQELAGLSKLVGMVEPGLHSIFSGFNILREPGDVPLGMRFEIAHEDERFNRITISVTGQVLRGQVTAFRRPPPIDQPSCDELRGLVSPDEFSGSKALVVGGSRGLGEITAKLLSLGGADVVITYATGDVDAQRVASEIRAAGGSCAVEQLDVRNLPTQQLDAPQVFDQLYYFATPFIFGKRGKGFDRRLLGQMMGFYVDSFYDLCAHFSRQQKLNVFYPSTIAVTERPAGLTEYAMAKAAGEQLCADLPRMLKNVKATIRRLPRLPTDQTSSVQPVETGSAVDEMLAAIRAVS
ncbi:SDR family NAD(P)-dependent oxidoreductase [Methylobacterium sp. B1]|uniref:SDR family NAD(P)-dependent oxidoreductase n=1 Tax=Methylobacterium sp. B1 TaxID=91459 RepID=UPI000345ED97|nr:SDR family NAD(P)-dependent oxidoreductase [Methylobacterium sp. B1]